MHAYSGFLGAVASLVLLPAVAARPSGASAADYTVAINFENACQQEYGSRYNAVLQGNSANDWKCESSSLDFKPIDVNQYCSMNYGNASPSSGNGGAYDWVCIVHS